MMDYVFRKNDIAWLNMWMLLLLMTSIYVKTHEGSSNGDQKYGCYILQISVD
jgi:hypothetical protein